MSASPVISPKFDALVLSGVEPFRLGLLGGTFDPVHYGHLVLAEQAYEQFGLDGVLFIPTGRPVRKLGTGVSMAEDRYAMLRAVTEDSPHFDVSRVEMDREGVSYSIDTVRAITAAYGERARLFFITGADATDDMVTWRESRELARLITVLGANRGESEGDGFGAAGTEGCTEGCAAAGTAGGTATDTAGCVPTGTPAGTAGGVPTGAPADEPEEHSPFSVQRFLIPALGISSKGIRARLARGGSARYLAPDVVLAYSQEHGLYGGRGGLV